MYKTFIGALLWVIAEVRKKPKCPSLGDWLNTCHHPFNGLLCNQSFKRMRKLCEWDNFYILN